MAAGGPDLGGDRNLGRLFLRLSPIGGCSEGSIGSSSKSAKRQQKISTKINSDRNEKELQRRRQRWLLRICYCKSRDHGRQTAEDDQIPAGVCEKGGHDQSQHRGHEEVSEPASIILVSGTVC